MSDAGGTVNWTSVETWQRLVASMIASGYKPDLKSVANYYGTTYHTLENRLRKIKKDAEVLKDAYDNGTTVAAAPKKAAPATPRKKKDATDSKPLPPPWNLFGQADVSSKAVASGRVTKKTPSKKTPGKKTIKKEPSDDGDADGSDDAAVETPVDSVQDLDIEAATAQFNGGGEMDFSY